jgi:hypothetical protein
MTLNMFDQFKHFETNHCITGSMRHIYAYNNFDISEDMLLGLGEGVGFIYWQQKGQPPFIGGRSTPEPGFEEIAGSRTGVYVTGHTTSSAHKGESTLLSMLSAGTPVMLQVDMGFLPYFDFDGQEYHFGGHAIVACGYDSITRQVLIADRENDLHPVPLTDLTKARASTFKPFPPKNKWFTFNFANKRMPLDSEIFEAIDHQAELMLNPPISNIGIKGIRKASKLIPQWSGSMDQEALKWALFNAYIFISPVGGCGGGLFRYMFSRFLLESARITGNEGLTEASTAFHRIADRWALLGEWFKCLSADSNAQSRLPEAGMQLIEIADLEQKAWIHLQTISRLTSEHKR